MKRQSAATSGVGKPADPFGRLSLIELQKPNLLYCKVCTSPRLPPARRVGAPCQPAS